MTLTELITVIAISSITMAMVTTVLLSVAKHDGRNLVRQQRTDQIRQVGFWVGDALAYASARDPEADADSGAAVLAEAAPHKITFNSALPIDGVTDSGVLSAVTLTLGEKCWTGEPDDEHGLLRRCVHAPAADAFGAAQPMCEFGSPDCADVFDDLILARDVKHEDPIFTYFFDPASGEPPCHSVPPGQLANIVAVELRVTISGDEPGDRAEATVFKRYSISKWRKL
ncbi:MAG: hypothetical protein LBG11_05375 [Bifidobacteriaceae bacterium]|jgi:hypothetical protein|nr:hypothetical protein [Bifidobacteriaceae bacterium]